MTASSPYYPLVYRAAPVAMGGKLSFAANANLIGARFDCGRSAGGSTGRPCCDASVRFEPVLAVDPACGIRCDGRSAYFRCRGERDGDPLRKRTFSGR